MSLPTVSNVCALILAIFLFYRISRGFGGGSVMFHEMMESPQALEALPVAPMNKFDVVYTWVDGTSPKFKEIFEKYNGKYDPMRFSYSNEIQLSLLLLSVNAHSWMRDVIIFSDYTFNTSFLVPEFSKKIRFVTQESVIPKEYFPIFNSHAIEAFIHKIPGLSEVYIYLNDDMMITRPLALHRFYTEDIGGAPRLTVPSTKYPERCSKKYLNHTKFPNKHNYVYTNTANVFYIKFGVCYPYQPTMHYPYIQNVTINKMVVTTFNETIQDFYTHRFRRNNDLSKKGDINFLMLSNLYDKLDQSYSGCIYKF